MRALPAIRLMHSWLRRETTPACPAVPPPQKHPVRRVTLDLTGLPPTIEDYEAFLQDSSSNSYEKVVDKLLASPRYAERWARHWMDVWRYSSHELRSRTKDLIDSNPKIWKWRDWLIESIGNDKGYHHMIVEMLAGTSWEKIQIVWPPPAGS